MSLNNEETTIHLAGGRSPPETQSAVGGPELNHLAISSINKLPSEVLADIMKIVSSLVPCFRADRGYSKRSAPAVQYPDALAQVCSYWRQVAIQTRTLWSHIDLTTWKIPSSRTITLLDRAGQSPLGLHVADRGYTPSVDLVPFLTPITSQLKSLDLIILSDDPREVYTSVLYTCLSGCTAGNLTELDIQFDKECDLFTSFFIAARDHPSEAVTSHSSWPEDWVILDVPRKHLEDILKGVTILRLNQIYPEWTSSAYHGLVELRLLGERMRSASITECQLVNILRHSPGLRILHFNLIISDLTPLDTTAGDPVVLKDLEVLNLDWMQEEGVEILFRWLAPSPKLSQFSLYPYNELDFKHPATVAFLASSNITIINADHCSLQEVVDLVGLCHHTRVLALNKITSDDTRETLPFSLHTLSILGSELKADCLRRWILSSSIQRLILYGAEINYDESTLTPDQIPAMLSDICPEVVVLPEDGPSPIEGWEVFWDYDY